MIDEKKTFRLILRLINILENIPIYWHINIYIYLNLSNQWYTFKFLLFLMIDAIQEEYKTEIYRNDTCLLISESNEENEEDFFEEMEYIKFLSNISIYEIEQKLYNIFLYFFTKSILPFNILIYMATFEQTYSIFITTFLSNIFILNPSFIQKVLYNLKKLKIQDKFIEMEIFIALSILNIDMAFEFSENSKNFSFKKYLFTTINTSNLYEYNNFIFLTTYLIKSKSHILLKILKNNNFIEFLKQITFLPWKIKYICIDILYDLRLIDLFPSQNDLIILKDILIQNLYLIPYKFEKILSILFEINYFMPEILDYQEIIDIEDQFYNEEEEEEEENDEANNLLNEYDYSDYFSSEEED